MGDNNQIPRRVFLLGAGGTVGAAYVAAGPLGLFDVRAADASTRTSFRLIRAIDQMVVDVDLLDLAVTGGNIAPTGPNPGALRFTFGSQHTAEATIDGTAGTPTALTLAFGHRVAGPSRVVFEVDSAIPFTLDSLLDLSQHELVLDDRATDQNGAAFNTGLPADDVTSIEIPYDLRISPHQFARFGTDAIPQSIDDVTEIFRLRIGRLNSGVFTEQPLNQPQGRAMHTAGSSDPSGPEAVTNYLPSMDDRADLVELLAGTERSFPIERLWLSPAGAAFSTSVGFPDPRPQFNDLLGWTQRVVTGRDTFVQIVTAGYVLPWGLPAAIIEQSERRFVSTDDGSGLTAAMVFERYLVTSPAPVDPNAGNGAPSSGRKLPFDEMRLGTIEQKPIGTIPFDTNNPDDAFWVTLGSTGNAILVPVTVTDKAGHEHTVEMPIAFVTESVGDDQTAMASHIATYNAGTGAPPTVGTNIRDVEFGGRRVGWTAPRTTDEGTLSTDRMRLMVEARVPNGTFGLPAFSPTIERGWIVDDTVAGATGQEQPSIEVTIPTRWLNNGDGGNNPAGAFLEYVNPINIGGFSGEGGGIGSPGFSLKQLSLAFGSGPDLSNGLGGFEWDPSVALSNAKILGFLDLGDIVNLVNLTPVNNLFDGVDLPEIPRFAIDLPTVPTIPEEVCYRFTWEPESLKTTDIFLAGSDAPEVSGDASMLIDILTCIAPLEQDASQTIDVEVRNFGIVVPPAPIDAISLGFHKVTYSKLPGQEATTKVDFAGLKFSGSLGFLEPVKSLFDSVGDVFSVSPTGTGIEAEAKFPIPPINLGVLGIKNLEGIVGVDISFDGSPVIMNASLGRKVDPFSVNVLSAGGTGWFELDASAETGIDRLAAGFSVTYSMGINVVVAKVSITGSIGGGIEVVNGEVTVLVIIGIEGTASAFGLSVGFSAELELNYFVNDELLRGIARVTVGFYSKIVDVEKTFEIEQEILLGDGNPPAGAVAAGAPPALAMAAAGSGFSDQYSNAAWVTYCESFA